MTVISSETIISKQWQGGYELYNHQSWLSGEAAARIVRTVLNAPCNFVTLIVRHQMSPCQRIGFIAWLIELPVAPLALTRCLNSSLIPLTANPIHYLSRLVS